MDRWPCGSRSLFFQKERRKDAVGLHFKLKLCLILLFVKIDLSKIRRIAPKSDATPSVESALILFVVVIDPALYT